jgi:glucosamine--fructose-6-phosphate aminotransferase (isomerizing)
VNAVLDEARRQGRPTIAITNEVASPLATRSDAVLFLEAGREQSVAATKTYVNSLGAVALLYAAMTGEGREQLERVPAQLAAQLERSRESAGAVDRLHGGTVVARGVNYATSFEIALKMRELSGTLFEAYSAADLMHGPVAAVTPGWPVIAVAPTGPAFPAMSEAIDAIARRGARLMIVSDDGELLQRADVPLPLLPGVPEWLSPLVAVVPGQLVALRLAQLQGSDVDHPSGLSKVTLTR